MILKYTWLDAATQEAHADDIEALVADQAFLEDFYAFSTLLAAIGEEAEEEEAA